MLFRSLFGPDGSKLSKRHGVTSVSAYRAAGYLPEAMFNYLSLLGWSYDPDQPLFSVAEAVSRFDLVNVSRNPAVFDPQKLLWMNGEYLRAMPADDFTTRARPFLERERPVSELEWLRFASLASLIQERVETLSAAPDMARFLFEDGLVYDDGSWRKIMSNAEAGKALRAARDALESVDPWETGRLESALRAMLDELELSASKGLQPIRVAVTGSHVSPPLFESLAALGRTTSLHRIGTALSRL